MKHGAETQNGWIKLFSALVSHPFILNSKYHLQSTLTRLLQSAMSLDHALQRNRLKSEKVKSFNYSYVAHNFELFHLELTIHLHAQIYKWYCLRKYIILQPIL